jgi:hypothetical protein
MISLIGDKLELFKPIRSSLDYLGIKTSHSSANAEFYRVTNFLYRREIFASACNIS